MQSQERSGNGSVQAEEQRFGMSECGCEKEKRMCDCRRERETPMPDCECGKEKQMSDCRCKKENPMHDCERENVTCMPKCQQRKPQNCECGKQTRERDCDCRKKEEECCRREPKEREYCMCDSRKDQPVDKMPIGIGYVPWQQFRDVSEPCQGLQQGTIFDELVMPWEVCWGNGKGRRGS